MSYRSVTWVVLVGILLGLTGWAGEPVPASGPATGSASGVGKVYVLPIREDIEPPVAYIVRRGVKEAMDAKADLLLIDMDTNGGRVDVTQEIIEAIGKFPGKTATFVNKKAFSAGAFISVATQHIFMAPQSVIGAAAPIMMMPGGGPEKLPDVVEAKMTSGIKALVRTTARKNGHNVDVIEAMIDRTKELRIGDKVLNKEGQILTLDDSEAAQVWGDPPKPLLSAGTVGSLDEVIERLGFKKLEKVRVEATGAERVARWINAVSPLLLLIGGVGLYIEFKTPGFGLPGAIGLGAFALYFMGSYVAGLAGMEWLIVFLAGVILFGLELFFFPGVVFMALGGAILMFVAILMAGVDFYPGMPVIPSLPQMADPLSDMLMAAIGFVIVAGILASLLPKTQVYAQMVSAGASGVGTVKRFEKQELELKGQEGRALCLLRPGGKAQFGGKILDVVSQGESIPEGSRVRVVRHSGTTPVVESVEG